MSQDNMRRMITKGRILVVEDEPLIGALIETIVDEGGYSCVGVCTTIPSAETLVRDVAMDAVLLDVQIKDELSYPFCKVLEEQDVLFGFLSGLDRDDIAPEWRGRPYCGKPFSDRDILEMLSVLMRDRTNVMHLFTSVIR